VAFSSTLEDSFVVVAVGLIGDVSLFKKVIEHCRCFAALEPRRKTAKNRRIFDDSKINKHFRFILRLFLKIF
jgi:hypothetical protein